MYEEDTIAAIATPPGQGGVAIVRISGPAAQPIAARLFVAGGGRAPAPFRSHRLHYGMVVDPRTGEALDRVLLALMRRPRSYTGEDVVEIHAHGGPLLMRRLLQTVLREGARLAQPGEFTKRAFLNGRLDLAQAEAVLDLIQAASPAALRLASDQLAGALSHRVEELRERLIRLVVHVEAALDFPEDDLPDLDGAQTHGELSRLGTDLLALADTFSQGKAYREGVRAAIVGKPNVGKSSLLNLLLGEERAIVTPVPGTTRDVLEEGVVVGDVSLLLWDTAGIRVAADEVERIGVEKARERIAAAQVLVAVCDASQSLDEDDRDVLGHLRGRKGVVVLNKIDLPRVLRRQEVEALAAGAPVVEASLKKGWGVEELKAAIHALAVGESAESDVVVSRLRHRDALVKAAESLERSRAGLLDGLPLDLVAVDLRCGLDHLGEITGHVTTEDILDRIFSEFCIGK